MKIDLHAVSANHHAARQAALPVLQRVSLHVRSGEQLAVIGPSGAGKTTLLQVIAAALLPSAGEIKLDDAPTQSLSAKQLKAMRGRLFLAPQEPPLPPRQRVVTSVLAGRLPSMSLWQSLRSLVYPSDLPAAYAALQAFDLGDKLFERVDRLSGGERQRVGLARALLAPASLWLVDEPLSALDPARSRQAIQTLTREAGSRSITLLTSMHDVRTALEFFPRIIGLREGVVVFDLPSSQVTGELLGQLYSQHEQELVGAVPKAPALEPVPVPVVLPCR